MELRLPVVEPLERALFLRTSDLFRDLRGRELAVLARLMREEWLTRGTVLHETGQRIHELHIIVDGEVRCERTGRSARRVAPPEAIGLIELLAQVETRSRAVVASNALALAIDAAAFRELLEEHFGFFLQIRAALGRQIRELRERLGADDEGAVEVVSPAPQLILPPRTGEAAGLDASGQELDLVHPLIWLHRTPHLGGFGAGVLAALVRERGEMRAAAGESPWQIGSEPRFLALLVRGRVRCNAPEREWRVESGALLGLDAAFNGLPHAYGAQAESDVVVVRVDLATLLDLAEDHFHVAFDLLAYCARLLLCLQEKEEG